jgi:hypothetical protein
MSLGDRIAVCISGQIRTGAAVAPAIKHFFGSMWPNIDFFIHTWTTESVSPWGPRDPGEDSTVLHRFGQEKIDQITDFYKPKSMQVDEFNLYQSQYQQMIVDRYGVCHSSIPMLQTLYESNKLKHNYEQREGSHYKLVVKMRFDQVFEHQHRFIDELNYIADKRDHVYVSDPTNRLPDAVEDIFWIANSANANTMADLALVRSSSNEHNIIDWQQHMRLHLSNSNISVRSMKNNNIFIYRNYHLNRHISPFDVKLLAN